MSTKCEGLEGTEKYAFGNTDNPVTEIQTNIIRFIVKHCDSRFIGSNSREAYEFISNTHTLSTKHKDLLEKVNNKEIEHMLEGRGTIKEFEEECRAIEEYYKDRK